ncbi:unnamed protein product [Urochloa humidicola]
MSAASSLSPSRVGVRQVASILGPLPVEFSVDVDLVGGGDPPDPSLDCLSHGLNTRSAKRSLKGMDGYGHMAQQLLLQHPSPMAPASSMAPAASSVAVDKVPCLSHGWHLNLQSRQHGIHYEFCSLEPVCMCARARN